MTVAIASCCRGIADAPDGERKRQEHTEVRRQKLIDAQAFDDRSRQGDFGLEAGRQTAAAAARRASDRISSVRRAFSAENSALVLTV